MSASHGETVYISEFVKKLPGASQAALVRGSDGSFYVAKFENNPGGSNVLFNESIGSELYRAAGLLVPNWKPLMVTQEFLDANRSCWIETRSETICPKAGLCYGSRFVGDGAERVWEILPGNFQNRVKNLSDFWLAWLIDCCAEHADNRQALFQGNHSVIAIFIDHGHMFQGATGTSASWNVASHIVASRYLDARIYENANRATSQGLYSKFAAINVDRLHKKLELLPESWKSKLSLSAMEKCLNRMSDSSFLQKTVWSMEDHIDHTRRNRQEALSAVHSAIHLGRRLPGSVTSNVIEMSRAG